MRKYLLLPLLLLPALAAAECSLARADGEFNIVVGRNATNCFNGAGFRESFLSGLNQALAAEQSAQVPAAERSTRRRSPPKVLTVEPTEPARRYYGQR